MTTFLHLHQHTAHFSFTFENVLHLLTDALIDTLKILPFLFFAFLIIELGEHHTKNKISTVFEKSGKAGPFVASLIGCIPQCAFSVFSANLYTGGVITLGTLIAVFLSTSDEAVLLLTSSSAPLKEILRLLVTKVIIAVICGYLIDLLMKNRCHYCHHDDHEHSHDHHHDLCEHDHCGCEENGKVLRPALIHTSKVFGFLLLFTIIIEFAVQLLGTERISSIMLTDSFLQPLVSALFGFIPNCATSVLLTQLYIEGAVSFGSLIAGLCTNAGAGLLVLFRNKSKMKDNLMIVAILYLCAVIPGLILHFTL